MWMSRMGLVLLRGVGGDGTGGLEVGIVCFGSDEMRLFVYGY